MVSDGEKNPLPSGPATLCFNKEDFMKDDFNVDFFVIECRRRVSLETLRDDLSIYLKILQSAMIELINKDYADFVNLSTNLVGLDKAINNLTTPLGQLKEQVMNVRSAMDEAILAVEEKLEKQAQIREKKACMQRLMSIIQSVEKIEHLLGIHSSESMEHKPHQSGHLSGQLIERVATEFNKLQFYVNKSRGLPLVEGIKLRIASITSTLQYSLEGSFREGLETGQVDILRQCLRTYATIDKMRDAENLFRQYIVKPYMEEMISEQFLQNNPQGLKGMYSKILEFIPKHCKKLKEATMAPPQGGGEVVRGYDFLVNAVWPEIIVNIEARIPSIFAPGNPDVFHEKYMTSMAFVDKFERQCGSQASVKRLRAHVSFNTFMSKWSLPVYFQIRFQEIAGSLETALETPFNNSVDKTFHLHVTETVWKCLHRCWQKDVMLLPLVHRFWKLTMQLLSRYTDWINEVQQTELSKMKAETGSKNGDGDQSAARTTGGAAGSGETMVNTEVAPLASPPITMAQIVYLLADAQKLASLIPDFYAQNVKSWVTQLGVQNTQVLEESMEETRDIIFSSLPPFGNYVVEAVTSQCSIHLKVVSDIPRLYRRTNREVPSKASTYSSNMLKPLKTFLDDQQEVLQADLKQQWINRILTNLSEQYLTITSDVLSSVKKTEESLKRLKKARGTASSSSQGMSDDDKIRQQIYLDVKDFGKQIEQLELKSSEIENYSKLLDTVEQARNTSASS